MPETVLIITPIEKAAPGLLAATKRTQPSTAKISPLLKPLQENPLIKSKLEAFLKAAAIPPKPAPVVVIAAAPKPEKKPVEVAIQPPPKPTPVAIVAPSVAKGAAEIDKRVTKSDQSLYFQSDSLLLTLYDNGVVDGDTVTVVMNGNVIFSKAGLSTVANSKTIYITPDMDSVNLVMYAENLGSIPPNTGLLIVNDGDKRYEVRFTADLQTNAGIVFRRKKNK